MILYNFYYFLFQTKFFNNKLLNAVTKMKCYPFDIMTLDQYNKESVVNETTGSLRFMTF